MKKIENKKKKMFKKRNLYFTTKSFLFLKFGDCGFFFKNNFNFEYVYFTFLKKKLKKIKLLNYKIWFFLNKNYPLSSKAKNSRMGKGKGDFLRWTYKIISNFFFIEFFKVHLNFLNFFKNYLNFKIPRKLFFFSNYFNFFSDKYLFSNYSYFFYKKYYI